MFFRFFFLGCESAGMHFCDLLRRFCLVLFTVFAVVVVLDVEMANLSSQVYCCLF